ncbi:hypothetical protein MTR67_008166, partial [Solanum verrucosum]
SQQLDAGQIVKGFEEISPRTAIVRRKPSTPLVFSSSTSSKRVISVDSTVRFEAFSSLPRFSWLPPRKFYVAFGIGLLSSASCLISASSIQSLLEGFA